MGETETISSNQEQGKIRILVAVSGNKNIPIPVENIACFYKTGNYTTLQTFQSETYLLNHSLDELMKLLEESLFFRANRRIGLNDKPRGGVGKHPVVAGAELDRGGFFRGPGVFYTGAKTARGANLVSGPADCDQGSALRVGVCGICFCRSFGVRAGFGLGVRHVGRTDITVR